MCAPSGSGRGPRSGPHAGSGQGSQRSRRPGSAPARHARAGAGWRVPLPKSGRRRQRQTRKMRTVRCPCAAYFGEWKEEKRQATKLWRTRKHCTATTSVLFLSTLALDFTRLAALERHAGTSLIMWSSNRNLRGGFIGEFVACNLTRLRLDFGIRGICAPAHAAGPHLGREISCTPRCQSINGCRLRCHAPLTGLRCTSECGFPGSPTGPFVRHRGLSASWSHL
jgi:hypothetical protein